MRKCNVCEFTVQSKQPGTAGIAEELALMTDHLCIHNASPAQWAEAYSKIQAKKKRIE